MVPRWHIFWGGILSILIWIFFPETAWYNLALFFLSSVLIDFDHYMCAVIKNKSLSLPKALRYYDKAIELEKKRYDQGIRRKGDFHVFHTIEFHALVFAIGLVFKPFLFIFLGMTFHSLLDIIKMIWVDRLYGREFFLTNWIAKRFK